MNMRENDQFPHCFIVLNIIQHLHYCTNLARLKGQQRAAQFLFSFQNKSSLLVMIWLVLDFNFYCYSCKLL